MKQITEIGGDKYYRLQQNYKGTGNTHLAYRIYVGIYEIIVDAHNAEILSMTATVVPETESVTGYMASDNENLNGFAIKKLGKYYYVMSDISRGLTVYTFNGRISQDDTRFWRSRATIVESTDQIFGNTEAEIALEYEEGAQLLLNVAQIYDYFKVLGFTFTGQNTNLYYNDGYDDGENAKVKEF